MAGDYLPDNSPFVGLPTTADTGDGALIDTFQALVDRVSNLEHNVSQIPTAPNSPAPLSIDDLPLGDLMQFLANNWSPSGQDLLLPASVGPAQLSQTILAAAAGPQSAATGNTRLAFGSGTVTWPGGSAFSNVLLTPHGLAVAPSAIAGLGNLPAGSAAWDLAYVSSSTDATNIGFRGHTTDGSSPAASTTQTFFWLAIG